MHTDMTSAETGARSDTRKITTEYIL